MISTLSAEEEQIIKDPLAEPGTATRRLGIVLTSIVVAPRSCYRGQKYRSPPASVLLLSGSD